MIPITPKKWEEDIALAGLAIDWANGFSDNQPLQKRSFKSKIDWSLIMILRSNSLAVLAVFALASITFAQDTGMERFKQDVGAWDAEVRMFEPGADKPAVSKGTEHVSMLGDMWLVSHFKGEMAGMAFEGASYTGYNADSKKYFGNWIDSMSNNPMVVEGTWDDETQTLTTTGETKGPDGSDMKFKMTTLYKKDKSRLFTMTMAGPDGEDMKMMEILYTKAKNQEQSPTDIKKK